MTIDELLDREAIRDVMAKCTQAGDRLKAEDYASCFAEDGVVQSERAPGEFNMRHVGRAAILAWQKSKRGGEAKGTEVAGNIPLTFARHNLSTSKIDLTGSDSATVRTYWIVFTDIGPDHSGYYLDDLRKIDGDWVIALRRVRTDWAAQDSLFVPRDKR